MFTLDLSKQITDKIQCTCCGQPNIFGYLCDDCKSELNTLLSSDDETKKLYLALGMRAKKQEFPEQETENK
jgi:hypothetical protein